jgi:hypothetical protein
MTLADRVSQVDTIIALAEEIARVAPECTNKALSIIEFARELGDRPDRTMIEDNFQNHSCRLSHPPL